MAIEDIRLKAGDAYLSNPNLKRANTTIQWTEEQIIEFLKCKQDPVYFARNYIKIVNVDDGLVGFDMWPFQEKLIRNFHDHRFNIAKMPRQCGKKFSLDTKIPTPSGWTTVGDVKIGDKIFGRDGKVTNVIAKSIIHEIDTYVIEFDNGQKVKACSEHEWVVSHSDWRHKERVLKTKDILKKMESLKNVSKPSSVYINVTEAIEMPHAELPIDPYTLGVWLGDGARCNGEIVGNLEDIEHISNNIPLVTKNKRYIKSSNNAWSYGFETLKESIYDLKLNVQKHIPDIYLRASIEQRLELLRGLMDTDGGVRPNGGCEFYQKEGVLLDQVRELISSLGIKSRIRYKKVKGYDVNYGTIRFCTNKYTVFKLPRKIERQLNNKNHPKNERLYIVSITKVPTEPMQCISVDNDEHLFLCTETFIPTHNSTTTVSFLLHYIIFNDNVNIGILANKATTSRELLSRLQLSYENLPKWMQHGVIAWNKGSVELENGSKILAASTSASAVRGMSFNIIFLDEFAFVPNHIADDFFASVYPTISSGKTTKVIVVSCVTDDTYVLTPKGIREMSDFIDYSQEENPNKGYEVPDYQVYGHKGPKDGNILVNSGYNDTKIIYSPSSFVECSLRHPWFVCDNGNYDWKKTSDLTGDEYIAIEYGHDVWDSDNTLPEIDYQDFRKTIKQYDIKEIDPDFAYFLGLYISEGSSNYNRNSKGDIKYRGITLTCGDPIGDFLDRLNLTYRCRDGLHYHISSTALCEVMQNLGFDLSKRAREKEIPKKLFRMSRENIIALIQGIMDGDGTSQKNRGTVAITLTSKKLIKQIRILLNNFGILSLYNESIAKPSKKVKVYSQQYRLELTGEMSKKYYDIVGFRFNRKQVNEKYLPERFTRNRYDIIPYSKDVIFSIKETNPDDYKKIVASGILKNNLRKNQHLSRQFFLRHKDFLLSLNNETINKLYDYVSENIKWEKITKIQSSKNKVYDFSLKETGDKWCHSVLFNNIIGSNTPKGMNKFYRMWHDAEKGRNDFVPTEVHWSDVPGRDEEWKRQTIANTSEEQFRVEHLCEFLGSVGTLINPSKLKSLVYDEPIKKSDNGLDVYEEPIEDHNYVMTVDVARGTDNDYSAFVVFDITKFPYKVVAKYRNNQIKPMLFPNIIEKVGKAYNYAWILAEINDIGDQVAGILHYDLEYDNILMCSMRGRNGQYVGTGFSGKRSQLGMRMTVGTKKLGCSNLRLLIEDDKLLISDYDIISELTTFIQKHNSFSAEEGCNDDLTICLVIFAWLVAQEYFKEMTNNDVRKRIYEENKNQIEQDMSPFGFISDGVSVMEEIVEEKETGDRWIFAGSQKDNHALEVWNLDEYGDVSNEWSYMWEYK